MAEPYKDPGEKSRQTLMEDEGRPSIRPENNPTDPTHTARGGYDAFTQFPSPHTETGTVPDLSPQNGVPCPKVRNDGKQLDRTEDLEAARSSAIDQPHQTLENTAEN